MAEKRVTGIAEKWLPSTGLFDSSGTLRCAIKILTDYPREDLAHDEVHQALLTSCAKRRVAVANMDVGAIPGLDTVVAGFKTAQLAMNSGLGFGHIFHTNCAPRKNIVSVKSAGEKIVLGMTPSGVALLMVNAGYALAPFHDLIAAGDIAFFQTTVPDSGSQFRSRDYFPDAVAELAAHLSTQAGKYGPEAIGALLGERRYEEILSGLSYLGPPVSAAGIPHLPQAAVFYVDNFGNIKLNFRHERLLALYSPGAMLVVSLGSTVCDAVVGDTGFSQGEGVIAVTSGSSGWPVGGRKSFFSEIFLRGGRAESHFPSFHTGDQVLGVAKADLQKVVEVLQSAEAALFEKLDLYNISEVRILHLLAKARLLRDGFDATELQKVLKEGSLLKKLAEAS